MNIISKEQLAKLREEFKPGVTVELCRMEDSQAPPIGTRGRCLGVDDIGSVMVAWSNGSSLSVVFGEDLCRVVSDDEETID